MGARTSFVNHSAISGEGFKSLAEGAKVESEGSRRPLGPSQRTSRLGVVDAYTTRTPGLPRP